MKKRPLVGIVERSFEITKTQLENANKFFSPVLASPSTIVQITSVSDQDIELVATFSPAVSIPNGVRRVAGQQTINTNVLINFSKDLTLHWMASVLKKGDISPNQSFQIYSSDIDIFIMPLNKYITLQHNEKGWNIPEYNDQEYTVNVGFGLGMQYISWGYSASCSPQMTLLIKAGSYDLVRSNGQEQIGDPVAPNQADWAMPMGYTYTLQFDSSGNGTLTRQ